MEQFTLTTKKRNQMVDITSFTQKALEKLVSKTGKKSGVVIVYCPHTTAAITVNENYDPDVTFDILDKLSRDIPHEEGYRHAEGNSDSHIKSSLVGCSETLIVENGQIQLGRWQGLLFCEFDGPRHREVWVNFLPA
ncbi:MAG: YjbQ family protein [candidate division Zixibacteria bacterium]|nr:YjbQ family protein [candidate division Zixibacteria bacterium]